MRPLAKSINWAGVGGSEQHDVGREGGSTGSGNKRLTEARGNVRGLRECDQDETKAKPEEGRDGSYHGSQSQAWGRSSTREAQCDRPLAKSRVQPVARAWHGAAKEDSGR